MKVPQPFPIRRRGKAKNAISQAPGQPDGLVLSKWRSESTPFGKPFSYTDAHDITKEYVAPRFGRTRANQMTDSTPRPRWRSWLRRFGRRPIGYVVVEPEYGQAYVCPPHEPVITNFDPKSFAAVYDERLIEASELYMNEFPDKP